MIKEELEKEAEEYSQKTCGYIRVELVQAFLAGAKPRENRIAELEAVLATVKEFLIKLLEEEKENMYWEMNGSDKSSYYEIRKQVEQFLEENKE